MESDPEQNLAGQDSEEEADSEPKSAPREGWTVAFAAVLVTLHFALILLSLRPPLETWHHMLLAPFVAGVVVGALDYAWKAMNQSRFERRGCSWVLVLIAYLFVYQVVGRAYAIHLRKTHTSDSK